MKHTQTSILLLLGAVAASAATSTQAADLLDGVKSRGTLRVAVEGTYPPFNFKDKGELAGFDVDVAKLVAQKLGVKAEFVTVEWSGILAGLAAGKYDVIVNQVGVTAKRQETFDFTVPYVYSAPQLIVRKDEKREWKSLDALKGQKLGVGQGSNFEQKAKATAGVDVRSYPGAPEYLADLAAGRVDAALNDSLMAAYLVKNSPLPIRVGAVVGEADKNAIPLVKGNPQLKAALDKALEDAYKDGSFKAVSVKWFGIDVSTPPAQR